jgi:hypothetical protein
METIEASAARAAAIAQKANARDNAQFHDDHPMPVFTMPNTP